MKPSIRFQQEISGIKRVWLDTETASIEISEIVKEMNIHADGSGQPTQVWLELADIPMGADIESGHIRVGVTTKLVLQHLGWTAPPDVESRREQATRRLGGIK